MVYLATYTGKKIDIETFSEDDVCLEDIAHHLAGTDRYGGALPYNRKISVATHSVNMADYALSVKDKLSLGKLALMHDATEAYLGDVNKALKAYLPEYKEIEARFEKVIFNKYNITNHYAALVKEIDTRVVLDEIKGSRPEHYHLYVEQLEGWSPLGFNVTGGIPPEKAKKRFLYWCDYLGIKD